MSTTQELDLIEAVENGNEKRVQQLLLEGADPNVRKKVTLSVQVQEHRLVKRAGLFSSEKYEEVYEKKTDAIECESALALAILHGHSRIVEALLISGAAPNGKCDWRIANCGSSWDSELWNKKRWLGSVSFPSPVTLAIGRGGRWKRWDSSTANVPNADGTLFISNKGGHVRLDNPKTWDSASTGFTIQPSLAVLRVLLRHGAVVSDVEITAASKNTDTSFLEAVLAQRNVEHASTSIPVAAETGDTMTHTKQAWHIDHHSVLRREEIGRGGFGVVYRCEWAAATVAGKFITALHVDSPAQAFDREVTAWYTAGYHPNILPLLGASWEGPQPFMLSKFMRNGNVLDYLQNNPDHATTSTKLRIFSDIAAGMYYLHDIRDIVHADLKPENALVDDDGTTRVGDFGTSKINNAPLQETTGNREGTGLYMPPERLVGGGATKEGDVYAFAITVLRIWTLRNPYGELDISALALYYSIVNDNKRPVIQESDGIPLKLQELIRKCWDQEPALRPTFRMQAMNIAAWTSYGPPSVLCLRSVPIPTVPPSSMLVRVHAAGIAGWDTEIRALAIPRPVNILTRIAFAIMQPKTLGQQFVGVVEKVGSKVTRFKKGDRIYGTTGLFPCAYAEFLVVAADKEATSPDNFLVPVLRHAPKFLSNPEASLLPLSGNEALSYVTQARIGPSSRLLLVGAAGSVGLIAAQIAKRHLGAVTVVAVDVGAARTEVLNELGCCDDVIDATLEQGVEEHSEMPVSVPSSYLKRFSPSSFDAIIDLPGKLSMRTVLPILAPGGLYLPIVPTISHSSDTRRTWEDRKRVLIGAAQYTDQGLATLEGLVEKGLLRVLVDKTFPLEKAREAHEHFEGGERRGGVVVVME
ncbi:hypothetical protein HDU93_009356 [Gonapodya sp. JEL0774]|nr:hypothetical protein HDU93_009356 [Gonapodya sp. JEL0774]